ncbi:MAG TPA: hypothetical protein VL522_02885 [Bordetella sp.]|nr:hypothetical protein [Bordetella sp.]
MLDLGRSVKGPVEFGAEGFKPTFDVDTKGYDSCWRNDIGGTGGLTKRGAGLLLMTGNNTYTGPTAWATPANWRAACSRMRSRPTRSGCSDTHRRVSTPTGCSESRSGRAVHARVHGDPTCRR